MVVPKEAIEAPKASEVITVLLQFSIPEEIPDTQNKIDGEIIMDIMV